MSKWTEVRDGLVAALDVKEVTESAKEQMITSLVTDGMDAIKKSVNDSYRYGAIVRARAEIEYKFPIYSLFVFKVRWIA